MIIRREGRPLPGSTSFCIPEINEGFFWQQSVPGEPFLPPLKKVTPKASLHNRETCLWRPWLIGRRLLKGWWTTLASAQGCRFGALCGCQKYPKPSPDHPLGPCHTPASRYSPVVHNLLSYPWAAGLKSGAVRRRRFVLDFHSRRVEKG